MKSPLSAEFKIACEIYRCNKKDIECTTPYLIKQFELYNIDKNRVDTAINTLFDWSMLKCEWRNEHRTYYIPSESKGIIKSMYKKYWKKGRKDYIISIEDACKKYNESFEN